MLRGKKKKKSFKMPKVPHEITTLKIVKTVI
jgi:hypothetical protein